MQLIDITENDCKLDFKWPDVNSIYKKIQTYKQERRKKHESTVALSAQEIVKAAIADPTIIESMDPGLKAQLLRMLGKS